MSEFPDPGWGWPGFARRAHYFTRNETRSICGGWVFSGSRFDEHDDHKLNCAVCKRKVLKLREVKP